MDYKTMTNSELAKIMVNYILRVDFLQNIISQYLDQSKSCELTPEQIKKEYKELKSELRKDADYLDLARNSKGSILYISAFSPSIREAAAFGFTVPVNAPVNFKMYSAVADAYYKLTKYISLEEWGELM